ncbi:MAG: YybH family protein [Vicinamibacterales bacterium]
MRRPILLIIILNLSGLATSAAMQTQDGGSTDQLLQELLTLERSALDRWIRLDPDGYLGLFSPDIAYFDPTTDKRVDGLDAMKSRLAPIKTMKAPFTDPRYEFIAPKVQASGDVAVLTFNLVSYGKVQGGPERVLARWNSTEVYRRTGATWRISHSHWSYTQPDIKPPAS